MVKGKRSWYKKTKKYELCLLKKKQKVVDQKTEKKWRTK